MESDGRYERGLLRHGKVAFSDGEHVAYLPHSCNEWIIGGRDNVRALIDDLTAWLDEPTQFVDADRLEDEESGG